jgi:transposase
LNDPLYQYYMNEALGDFRGQSAREGERLSNLYTDIYGETGQLKNFDTQATQDQRRLAAEMASRGTLRSGAYSGGERGLGTEQQKQQVSQRAGIEKGYTDQTSPQALFDQGLTRGPDNKVRELVQGEEISWKDPATGETKKMKYDWTQTSAGRAAKQAALQQWMQKQLAGVSSVM